MIRIEYQLQFFAQEGPGGEKTEPATGKKLDDARKEGKVAKSKELSAAIDLIALFTVLKLATSFVGHEFQGAITNVYEKIPEILNNNYDGFTIHSVKSLLLYTVVEIIKLTAPFLLVGFIATFLICVVQVGFKITGKPLEPKLNKLNPLNGFKRMFSKESVFELLKAVVKVGFIGVVAYNSIKTYADDFMLIYDIPFIQSIIVVGEAIIDTGLKISLYYLFIGLADFIFQKRKFNNEMMMTKQEVKDEFKNTEGNPEIKGRQKQKMREVSQRRMMQAVPEADVIITNPTHLSVAIRYDKEKDQAPVVIAKGEDFLAMKIREIAKEHHIEIMENKPLARMLYTNVDVGKEIPPELYQAVADILVMVYNIKGKYN